MLQLSNTFINRPVLSLRTGAPVAVAVSPIINPTNLKIEGFHCSDSVSKQHLILVAQDIRDFIQQGIVINDHEVLAEPDELVRLQKILELNFDVIGKPVETLAKEKVGKVGDYAADPKTLYIQKLYVSQSLLKSLGGGTLSIDRTQINEITPKHIVINDLTSKVPAAARATA